MTCRMAQLQDKELVSISDGTRYGFIGDLEIDADCGAIRSIIVYGRPRLFGLLGRERDLVFPWSCVRRVGDDLILIDEGPQEAPRSSGREIGEYRSIFSKKL